MHDAFETPLFCDDEEGRYSPDSEQLLVLKKANLPERAKADPPFYSSRGSTSL